MNRCLVGVSRAWGVVLVRCININQVVCMDDDPLISMWGDVFFQEDLTSKSCPNLLIQSSSTFVILWFFF